MTHVFKVGDRVRCVNNTDAAHALAVAEYTVTSIDGGYVGVDSVPRHWDSSRFELVTEGDEWIEVDRNEEFVHWRKGSREAVMKIGERPRDATGTALPGYRAELGAVGWRYKHQEDEDWRYTDGRPFPIYVARVAPDAAPASAPEPSALKPDAYAEHRRRLIESLKSQGRYDETKPLDYLVSQSMAIEDATLDRWKKGERLTPKRRLELALAAEHPWAKRHSPEGRLDRVYPTAPRRVP